MRYACLIKYNDILACISWKKTTSITTTTLPTPPSSNTTTILSPLPLSSSLTNPHQIVGNILSVRLGFSGMVMIQGNRDQDYQTKSNDNNNNNEHLDTSHFLSSADSLRQRPTNMRTKI
ncbi:hypothetical protein DERF_012155 [Dermatophagoides farinae]|uniref:Uncharacterized protein n=1 Tax=Dermatophagoides farinae TaxID=6954 RepID=A0A922HS04_DERFA|nr:hypothetical protein DERF_012155 [Dermatophagoides farinae]